MAILWFIAGVLVGGFLIWLRMANVNDDLSAENLALHGKLQEQRIIAAQHRADLERACHDIYNEWEQDVQRLTQENNGDIDYWRGNYNEACNALRAARKRFDQPRVNGRFVKREVPEGARERLMEQVHQEQR